MAAESFDAIWIYFHWQNQAFY